MRVLVLEDSEVMQKVIIDHLLALGLQESEIIGVDNGAEALRQLNAKTFELLILDIVMGEIDGIAVYKKAQQIQPQARAIICSSFCEINT